MKRKKTARSRSYHHGDLKNALVEVAAKLVAERGAASVSLREVARSAGVSHAAPYHHFKDKSGLIAAVAEEGFRRFDQFQERALRKVSQDPHERLKALGHAYVRFAIANPNFFRVMFRGDLVISDHRYPSLAKIAKQTLDRLIDTVRNIEALSGIHDSDPSISAIRAWAFVHGLANLWLDGRLDKFTIDQKRLYDLIDTII